jgi:Flp pilus assembly protein TadD
MALEFSAARSMHAPPQGNADRLRALRARATPPAAVTAAMSSAGANAWAVRGSVALKAGAFEMAHESFRRAVALDPRSAVALRGSSDAAAALNRDERQWLNALAAAEPDNPAVRVELARVLAAGGQPEEAIAAAMDARRVAPASPEPIEQLGSIFADMGDGARVAAVADDLIRRFPAREEGRYYQAVALFLSGRSAEAGRVVHSLLSVNPRHARAQNLRGVVCASLGSHECARAAFESSIAVDPHDASTYVNLGNLHLERGDRALAADLFSEALAIDNTSEAARRGLVEARGAQ